MRGVPGAAPRRALRPGGRRAPAAAAGAQPAAAAVPAPAHAATPPPPAARAQHPATHQRAEATLLQFRNSAAPLAACQHLLERSPSAEARFHAAVTLRDAAMREWAATPPPARAALRSYALGYAAAHAGDPALSVVRGALAGAAALLLKRGWGEMAPPERAAFFHEVSAMAAAAPPAGAPGAGAGGGAGPGAGPARLRASLEVLEAVVGEFSLATASALGLPWEYHERCRDELEVRARARACVRARWGLGGGAGRGGGAAPAALRAAARARRVEEGMQRAGTLRRAADPADPRPAPAPAPQAGFLPGLFRHALDVARSSAAGGAAAAGGDGGACGAAMALMTAVLHWPFKGAAHGGGGGGGAAARRGPADACAALRPGQAWGELLLAESSTDWLLALLPQLRGAAAGAPLAERARQLAVAFCSLAGDVFPRAPQGDPAAAPPASAAHCARMLRAAAPWVSPARGAPAAAMRGDESELVDGCRCGAARGAAPLRGPRAEPPLRAAAACSRPPLPPPAPPPG